MQNNINHLNADDWGIDLVKQTKKEERNYQRWVKAFYFFLGVITAGVVMHILFISPLFNALV